MVPKISAPRSVNFPKVTVGTTLTDKTMTIKNTGKSYLVIIEIYVTGANDTQFSQTNTCVSPVSAGGTCSAAVTFTPDSKGKKTAILSIASDDPKNPVVEVKLSGTGK